MTSSPLDICAKGDLVEVQRLVERGYDKLEAFQLSCVFGHLAVVQWLLSNDPSIDIHAQAYGHDEYAFYKSCESGYFDLAQWLWQLSLAQGKPINIHVDKDVSFLQSYRNGHFHVAQWLVKLGKTEGQTPISRYALEEANVPKAELVSWLTG